MTSVEQGAAWDKAVCSNSGGHICLSKASSYLPCLRLARRAVHQIRVEGSGCSPFPMRFKAAMANWDLLAARSRQRRTLARMEAGSMAFWMERPESIRCLG